MLGGDLRIPVLPVQFVYPSPLATDLLSVPRFLPFGYTSSLLLWESHPAQKEKKRKQQFAHLKLGFVRRILPLFFGSS